MSFVRKFAQARNSAKKYHLASSISKSFFYNISTYNVMGTLKAMVEKENRRRIHTGRFACPKSPVHSPYNTIYWWCIIVH